ncbi:hypothetical protein CSW98_12465 [Vibrio sp. HA2012]|uniref:bifunctional diguanylate cyclase/phosphodiesterase n=1 Tax=Vibrio sp. HA2012 TaxID=1971595 RepID=UPI000C2B8837|nr:EAL domain-containing protein [Vibrio sp. HA2012]PJC85864.1 hypothetical protein CSW98_12465 [Vibrio sp. HA2012]
MTRFTLTDKASFLLSSGILLIVLVCLLLTRFFYTQQIEDIEQIQLIKNSEQAQIAINRLTTEQEEYSYDWAHWDETYLLLKENDMTYAERNLHYSGLDALKLSLIMYINKDGKVIESAYIPEDQRENEVVTKAPESTQYAVLHSPLLQQIFNFTYPDIESKSGLLTIDKTLWIISVTGVSDSLMEHRAQGWMVWGTPLSSKFPVKFKALLPDQYDISLLEDAGQTKGSDIVRTQQSIVHTSLLRDIDGQPVARLKTTERRILYEQANQLINTISLILGVASFIIIAATLYLFRTRIGASFSRMEKENQTQSGLIDILENKDLVSGLHNRHSVLLYIHEHLIAQDPQLSLLYISVERLKSLSRIFGYQTVEVIIRHLAQFFTLYAPKPALIGRVAENDFVILCNSSEPVLLKCAEKINHLYGKPTIIDDLDIHLDICLGYLDSCSGFRDAEEVLTCAKYTAQLASTGPDKLIHFSDAVTRQFNQHKQLQRDLSSAIKNEDITPYYQPIVHAVSGEAIGFEALARWKHAELGMISPAIFIPMAEERNFIIALGEQILDQSCRFISDLNKKRQQHALPPMTVHVNLSAPHLQHHNLLPYIEHLLQKYNLPPHLLTLELTESILIDSVSDVIAQLTLLRSKGMRIAIDDFGTGYSSLSTLSSFPVDIIKLDRNFVLQLEQNKKGYALIKNIVQLAKDMQLNTVVEGIETSRQREVFVELNVDKIQGFYFYKPMPMQSALYEFSEPEY